jgi:hypothetical protein
LFCFVFYQITVVFLGFKNGILRHITASALSTAPDHDTGTNVNGTGEPGMEQGKEMTGVRARDLLEPLVCFFFLFLFVLTIVYRYITKSKSKNRL